MGIACRACDAEYPLRQGVPILHWQEPPVDHSNEGSLETWSGFEPWIAEIMASVPRCHPILDLGSGNRDVSDDRLVRMDAIWTPFVDVVGDAHRLPFRDDSFGMVYASALFEHLRDPFRVAQEIHRILIPGGYVIADCAFVFPFHGYPKVYFNASADGLRQIFSRFKEALSIVAPWQMPSYSVRAVLGEYFRILESKGEPARAFLSAARAFEHLDLSAVDRLFTQEEASRIAAGTTYMGAKNHEEGEQGLLPDDFWGIWRSNEELQSRYPDPWAPVQRIRGGHIDSFLVWASGEGCDQHSNLRSALRDPPCFQK